MATARAVANGNWSNTATWNGGVLPGNGDTVYASGFTVTIDTSIDIGGANNPIVNAGSFVAGQWYIITTSGSTTWTSIGSSSNNVGTIFLATGVGSGTGQAKALATLTTAANAAAGASAGGVFTMTSSQTQVTTDIRSGTTTCLTISGNTSTTFNNILITNTIATGSITNGITSSSTGTLTFNNCNIAGPFTMVASSANTLLSSAGSVVINGSTISAGGTGSGGGTAYTILITGGSCAINSSTITGGTNAGGSSYACVFFVAGTTMTISSTVITGGPNNINNHAVVGGGTLNVSSCTLNGSLAAAINSDTTLTTITNSDFIASSSCMAVVGTSSTVTALLSGRFYDHWSGHPAIYVRRYRLGTAPTNSQHRFALAGTTDSYFTFYGADYAPFGNPAITDVRFGVVYGGGALVGTAYIPSASSVAAGVPVDNTVGTAVLTAADVTSAVPTASGIASQVRAELATELARLATCATVQTTGDQIVALLSD